MNTALWPENANECPVRVTVKAKGGSSRTGDVKLMLRTFAEPILPQVIASDDDGTALSGYAPEDDDSMLLLAEFMMEICGTEMAEET